MTFQINSVKFCTNFTRAREKFTPALLARWNIFPSLALVHVPGCLLPLLLAPLPVPPRAPLPATSLAPDIGLVPVCSSLVLLLPLMACGYVYLRKDANNALFQKEKLKWLKDIPMV